MHHICDVIFFCFKENSLKSAEYATLSFDIHNICIHSMNLLLQIEPNAFGLYSSHGKYLLIKCLYSTIDSHFNLIFSFNDVIIKSID